jgi:hypothetical protein
VVLSSIEQPIGYWSWCEFYVYKDTFLVITVVEPSNKCQRQQNRASIWCRNQPTDPGNVDSNTDAPRNYRVLAHTESDYPRFCNARSAATVPGIAALFASQQVAVCVTVNVSCEHWPSTTHVAACWRAVLTIGDQWVCVRVTLQLIKFSLLGLINYFNWEFLVSRRWNKSK